MGGTTLSKGERLRAMHHALLAELGDGAKLTIKQAFQIFSRCFDVWSTAGVYNQLDAMDLSGYIEWDRDLRKDKGAKCIIVLPSESHADTPLAPPEIAA